MIKAEQFVEAKKHERIDALAQALGFTFTGGKYIKSNDQSYPRSVVRRYTAAVNHTRTTKRKYTRRVVVAATPTAVAHVRRAPVRRFGPIHQIMRGMAVGQTLDISADISRIGEPRVHARKLLRSFAWHERTHHGIDFKVDGQGLTTTVTRIS